EDLEVEILIEGVQDLHRIFGQIRFRSRNIDQASQQHRELITGRQTKVPDFSFDAIGRHDQRGYAIDAVFPCNLAICRYFMDLKMKLLRKRHNFLEKSSCVLASRAILPAGNNQRRVTLREKQQLHVAGEVLEDLLDFSLSLR